MRLRRCVRACLRFLYSVVFCVIQPKVDGVDSRRFCRQSTAVDGGRPARGAGPVYPGRLGRRPVQKSTPMGMRAVATAFAGRAAGQQARVCRKHRRMRSASRCFGVLSKTCELFLSYGTDTGAESRHVHSLRLSRPLTHTHTSRLPTSRQTRDPKLLLSRPAPCSGAFLRRSSRWWSSRRTLTRRRARG